MVCKATLLLLILVACGKADDLREVRGRVIDEAGNPVPDADVCYLWRANGVGRGKNGKWLDIKDERNEKEFWGHLGKMEPFAEQIATTASDGSFTITFRDVYHTLMAMDRARSRGGLASVPSGDADRVEIRLSPLIEVRGRLDGPEPGQKPKFTHVYTLVPDDPTQPLHSSRLVSCGSYDAEFRMSLPAGRYWLHAYNDDTVEAQVIPNKEIMLTANTLVLDLGVLHLAKGKPNLGALRAQSLTDGRWWDYTKHYGEKPPKWHAVDARGIKKDAELSDFEGKWVLLDFWGFGCRPCLKTGLPKLTKFYEEHAAQRDQFEIVSICIDIDGELKTMADVDQKLAPIIEHVWSGKSLPFPIILDPTFKTWERFGLSGLGTVLLIDPHGNLVEGEEEFLAQQLK